MNNNHYRLIAAIALLVFNTGVAMATGSEFSWILSLLSMLFVMVAMRPFEHKNSGDQAVEVLKVQSKRIDRCADSIEVLAELSKRTTSRVDKLEGK